MMFKRITYRKLTDSDTEVLSGYLKINVESAIQQGFAYGAFKKGKCISYILPINAMLAYSEGVLTESCATREEWFKEILLNHPGDVQILCIPIARGDYIKELLQMFCETHSDGYIIYTPYFNNYKAFSAAGFKTMTLKTGNKEILIK